MFSVHKPTLPNNNAQVQCPACGAHSTNVTVHWQDPRTGHELSSYYGMDPLYAVAIVLVSGVVSFLITGAILGPDSNCAALALTALLSLGIITAYTVRSVRQ